MKITRGARGQRKRMCVPASTFKSQENLAASKRALGGDRLILSENQSRRVSAFPGRPGEKFCLSESLKIFRSNTVAKYRLDSSSSQHAQHRSHFMQMFRDLKLIQSTKTPADSEVVHKLKNLPKRKEDLYKKTLVFDLHETLVQRSPSFKVRPHAREALKELGKLYEIILFTASSKENADPEINQLDPTGELITHRLYQEDCFYTHGGFVKDLRIINRNLENMLLIDNSVWSFAHQIDNGVPVLPWTGDPYDTEMRNLVGYLTEICKAEDLRDVNRETFKLHSF